MPAAIKKRSSVKKTSVAKKPVAKKPTAKTKAASVAKPLRSFRPAPITEPFFSFRLTRQTVYWLILAAIIIGLVAWVIQLTVRVETIYDQMQQNDTALQSLPAKKSATPTKAH